jgi:cytochrome c553
MSRTPFAFFTFAAVIAACSGTNNAQTTTDPAPTTTAAGLPCDVTTVLAKCTSCHGQPPTGGAPIPLVSRDDLVRASDVDPSQTVVQRAVARMMDTNAPMPPKPADPATGADIATLQGWIDQGMPVGECNGDPGTSLWSTPVQCTSGRKWTLGDRGSPSMHPGGACISCHATKFDAPRFAVAGTVYPSAHEPDDCASLLDGAAQIEITDANKKVYTLNVNASGNFYYVDRLGTFAQPYTAKVLYQGRERIMVGARDNGDCNSCHTQDGTESAPGRILLP